MLKRHWHQFSLRTMFVMTRGHLICLDTGCCTGGWLTAMEVMRRTVWQVDERGLR